MRPSRVLPLLLAAGLALSACESSDELDLEPVPGFDGVVATGEPNAAVVAREILARGGTVADVAVAVTFSMAVTYPSRISLAGGGACLIHDRERQVTEALSFLPLAAPSGGVPPGLARGMEALHARYGALPWAEMIAPGEAFARFGVKVSRALSADLNAAQQILSQDEAAAALLLPGGRPLASGAVLKQPELAQTLAGLRKQGAAYFLTGPAGPAFAAASSRAGMPLTEVELRNRVPVYQQPLRLQRGSEFIFLTPPPAANGLVTAEIYQILATMTDYEDEAPNQRQHLFLEASAQSFADRGGWLTADGTSSLEVTTLLDPDVLEARLTGLGQTQHKPAGSLVPAPRQVIEPLAGTGFVVGDRYGNAIACSLTNNGLFGSGRLDRESGILLAAVPPGNLAISPVAAIATSVGTQRARMAAAGAGGAAGATAMARILLDVLEREQGLRTAMAEIRVHHNGLPDVAFVEDRADGTMQQALVELGHRLQLVPGLGEVQAWSCPEGILQEPALCEVEADPRGFGLSQVSP
ncbi:MAG: gamma-glutamyltransferase [Rhodospirillales bacterium]